MSSFKVIPIDLERPWGGELFGQGVGERWVFSTLDEGLQTYLKDGKLLKDHLENGELSFLVKFIDTKENLSIQVHPNREMAREYAGDKGKDECWTILGAEEGSGVYLGLKEGIPKDDFIQYIQEGCDISRYLQFFPVKKGDFFYVPAGTIHAIGKGVTLLEVQQSSGTTYRVWDWGRKGRELHIEKALKVSHFFPYPEKWKKKNVFQEKAHLDIWSHSNFQYHLHFLKKGEKRSLELLEASVFCLASLGGRIKIDEEEHSFMEVTAIIHQKAVSIEAIDDAYLAVVY